MSANAGFLTVDVGSSRVKLGWFPAAGPCESTPAATALPIASSPLPQPASTLAVAHADQARLWTEIGAWLADNCPSGPPGFLASVHPSAATLVQEMFGGRLRQVTAEDLPLAVRVDQPERVGIDRLLNAVAVNRIRRVEQPAIVVDLGTACTVDLIAADGAFEGGAILPGVSLSASALHAGTETLPQLSTEHVAETPDVVGKSTQAAISSGLYWGMIGAVRELVERISRQCTTLPQLFLTGGGANHLVEHLTSDNASPRHDPHLVLSGLAIVADEIGTRVKATEEAK